MPKLRQIRRSRQVETLETRALLSTITVTSLQDNLDTDGKVTLREALLAADEDRSVDGSEAGDGADTIVFASGFGGASIRLNGKQLRIASDVTIDGPSEKITLDANGRSRILSILDANQVNLTDLRFENGDAVAGGAIRSRAVNLSVTRTEFHRNDSVDGAGAVYVVDSPSGSLRVNDSLFVGNSSDEGSGAIRTETPDDVAIETVISDSEFRSNRGEDVVASSLGADDLSLVSDSVFANNIGTVNARVVRRSSFTDGSGVSETHLVEDSNFIRARRTSISMAPIVPGNEQSVVRNTVLVDSDSITVDGCSNLATPAGYRLENVTATNTGLGGGCENSVTTVYESEFVGASLFQSGELELNRTTIRDSSGIAATSNVKLIAIDSEISGNRGGLTSRADLEATNTTISGNKTAAPIFADGLITLNHVTVAGNQHWRTAAVRNDKDAADGGLTTIRNSIIADNFVFEGTQLDIGRYIDDRRPGAEVQIFSSLIGSNEGTEFAAAPPGTPDGNGNMIGTNDQPIDPRIGVINDNGGTTRSRALAPSSPARDAAVADANIPNDQVGRSRTTGSAPDMGAFEFDPSVPRLSPKFTMELIRESMGESEGDMVIRVGLTDVPADGETVVVDITTSGIEGYDGATVGEDFEDASTPLTFDATTSPTRIIRVPLIDDEVAERDQFFDIVAERISGDVEILTSALEAEIESRDRAAVRWAEDVTVREGDDEAILTFTLDREVDEPFVVTIQAIADTATEDDFGDFDGTLEFTGVAGQSFELRVPIIDDTEREDHELFRIHAEDNTTLVSLQRDSIVRIESDDPGAFVDPDGDRLVVIGTEDADTVTITGDDDESTVTLNGNSETFDTSGVSQIVIRTGSGSDTITVQRDIRTVVEAGKGNDRITTAGGRDWIMSGPGNDRVFGGSGSDLINAGDGRDTIYGQDGDDYLHGEGGHDSILGGSGNDRLRGNLGHDTLKGGWGRDGLHGSYGHDLLRGDQDRDYLQPGNGTDTVYGGGGGDYIDDAPGQNEIYGEAGADFIISMTGTVYGGNGNDTIYGTNGFGEDGDDYLFADDPRDDEINLLPANLIGGNGHDTLIGSLGADTLQAGPGNDLLVGGGGPDLLHGDEDRDTLFGMGNKDTLVGGDHPDILIGGGGDDSLDGGRHKDVLFGGTGEDTLSGGGASDLLNASSHYIIYLENGDGLDLADQLLNTWRTNQPYADRIAAVSSILDNHAEAVGWDTQDSDVDVFQADPSVDWLHVDSDMDQFTREDDELFVELNE